MYNIYINFNYNNTNKLGTIINLYNILQNFINISINISDLKINYYNIMNIIDELEINSVMHLFDYLPYIKQKLKK